VPHRPLVRRPGRNKVVEQGSIAKFRIVIIVKDREMKLGIVVSLMMPYVQRHFFMILADGVN
jgi:hypothetical protein